MPPEEVCYNKTKKDDPVSVITFQNSPLVEKPRKERSKVGFDGQFGTLHYYGLAYLSVTS